MINEEVLHRIKEERNILRKRNRRKANWIRHIVRRNCLLRLVTEGKIEVSIGVTGDEEEVVRNYWMVLRKREGTGN